MKILGKAMLIIVAAALLLPIVAFAAGDVEYRPGEKASESLFNKGIGSTWTGGEPFKSSQSGESMQTFAANAAGSYQILGYLDAVNSIIIASDGGKSLKLMPGAGSFPIYGYFKGDKLMGIFIDLSSSEKEIK